MDSCLRKLLDPTVGSEAGSDVAHQRRRDLFPLPLIDIRAGGIDAMDVLVAQMANLAVRAMNLLYCRSFETSSFSESRPPTRGGGGDSHRCSRAQGSVHDLLRRVRAPRRAQMFPLALDRPRRSR